MGVALIELVLVRFLKLQIFERYLKQNTASFLI